MHENVGQRFALLLVLGVVAGCNTGGVTVGAPPPDGSIVVKDVGPNVPWEAPVIIVNLDVPSARDGGVPICTTDAADNCIQVICGDGKIEGSEECDDGNTNSMDGCTAGCKLETDYICPTPGAACVSTVVCGDGRISGTEVCDDYNTKDGDGCSADCHTIEPGWICPAPGARCQPKCGDGVLVGAEQCDDGNTTAGDGCSASCATETGFT